MTNNIQYIGARYVPKFATPIEWDKNRSYEALEIVTYLGTSYTSRKPVPAQVDIGNEEYWVVTGNYNAQVNALRDAVAELNSTVSGLYNTGVSLKKPPAGLTACDPTGKVECAANVQAIVNYARANKQAVIVDGVYRISTPITLTSGDVLVGLGTNKNNYDVNNKDNTENILSGFFCVGFSGAINIPNNAFSVYLSNFAIVGPGYDDNSGVGINCDRLRDSVFENLRISYFNTGLKLSVNNALISDDNTMYNTFANIRVDRCTSCVVIDGGVFGDFSGNACHNTFTNLSLDAYGTSLKLGDSDNNTFLEVYCYRRSGDWDIQLGEKCRSNYFYHVQGRILTSGGYNNWVFGYDRENGQKMPYLTSGNLKVITSDGVFLDQSEDGNAYLYRWKQGEPHPFGDVLPGTGTLVLNKNTAAGQPLFYTLDAGGRYKGQVIID